jgi:hypothetical protein
MRGVNVVVRLDCIAWLKPAPVRADSFGVMHFLSLTTSLIKPRLWRWALACLCLTGLCSGPVRAEWSELEKEDDIAHFWDKESIRRVHVTRYVWTLTDLPKAIKGPSGENFQSSMTRWRLHCKSDMFIKISVSYFEKPQGKGREVASQDDPEWRLREAPIRPGTYLSLLKKELCDSPS